MTLAFYDIIALLQFVLSFYLDIVGDAKDIGPIDQKQNVWGK